MDARRDVFQAIADPTRRAILHLLSTKNLNLNAVADHFEISRPAVSKHIKILAECGLINIKQEGRERYCQAQLQKLQEVEKWTHQYSQFWDIKLKGLKALVEQKNEIKSLKKVSKKRKS